MKLGMLVAHTSGTRSAKILAKDVMSGRSLDEFGVDWMCTWKNIHEVLLGKQRIKAQKTPYI